jgi:hypothetical protein
MWRGMKRRLHTDSPDSHHFPTLQFKICPPLSEFTTIGTTTTLDGYQHAIAGTSTGNVVDFAWTDPTQHTTSTPETLPASVAGLSVLITNGVIQANAITSDQAYNVSWGNGTTPSLNPEGTYM